MTYKPTARRIAADDTHDFAVSRTPALPHTYREPDRPHAWVGYLLIVAGCTVGAGIVLGLVGAAVIAIWRAMS